MYDAQAIERLDGHGLPMQISHEVYINAIKLPLPIALDLTAADRAKIRANYGSAYTEDYNLVLDMLRYSAVHGSLIEFANDVNDDIVTAARTLGVPIAQLTLRQIAHAMFARPTIQNGGATYFDVLQALMKTDTKSYEDLIRIFSHIEGVHIEASWCCVFRFGVVLIHCCVFRIVAVCFDFVLCILTPHTSLPAWHRALRPQ